jgi:hypothetical protein
VTTQRIGIVANPASGKDVRRLVAQASVFDNREKCAIIRRALSGALNAGADKFAYLDDSHNIAGGALEELAEDCDAIRVQTLETSSALDTTQGARNLEELNPIATLILGGDGTSRAFVKGWRSAVLLPLSTGTNNVFPRFAEATVAGAALGVLATGVVTLAEATVPVKIIDIEIEGEHPDIALIDAVVTKDKFIGSRALLDGGMIERIFLTRAEPMAVGMTSVGGLLRPLPEEEDAGLHLTLGPRGKHKIHAPIAPGMYETIRIKKAETVAFDEVIEFTGPCVLAFDGEREREIQDGQKVSMRLSRTGPSVLDIEKTMQLAACRQAFQL